MIRQINAPTWCGLTVGEPADLHAERYFSLRILNRIGVLSAVRGTEPVLGLTKEVHLKG